MKGMVTWKVLWWRVMVELQAVSPGIVNMGAQIHKHFLTSGDAWVPTPSDARFLLE